jgi:ABC-type nitrate/sulfonate/bicarbonate transport system substrate-binding protein
MPMRPHRRVRLAASLIAVALCAGCGEVHATLAPAPLRPLTVAVDAPASAPYAPLYVAAADGDFRRAALAVAIAAPPDPLATLQSGAAAVAIVSEPRLLQARADGAQVVAIGALSAGPLAAIVAPASHPLASAHALAGVTLALDGSPLHTAELATIRAVAHLNPGSLRTLTLPAASLAGALSDGRAGAVLADPWPALVAALEHGGRGASVLALSSAGVPTYSQLVIAVRVHEAHYDGPLLRAFLQALVIAQRTVVANRGATAAILASANPKFGAGLERLMLAQLAPLAASGQVFGYQNPYSWQTFGVWMRAYGLLHATADAGLAITTEFLPGQGEPSGSP